MIRHGTRLAAQVSYYGQQVDFYLADYRGGKHTLAKKIVFEKTDEAVTTEPSFRLEIEVAQELFEQLWAQGFRSKHDQGNADKLDAARQEHLADLRKAAKLG
jgi:hypothetical protein